MRKTLAYVWLLMSLFYIFIGSVIAIRQVLPSVPPPIYDYKWTYFKDNPTHFNYLMGFLLIAYGIYRLFRSYKTIKGEDE